MIFLEAMEERPQMNVGTEVDLLPMLEFMKR